MLEVVVTVGNSLHTSTTIIKVGTIVNNTKVVVNWAIVNSLVIRTIDSTIMKVVIAIT
jgi:hypothetical protein